MRLTLSLLTVAGSLLFLASDKSLAGDSDPKEIIAQATDIAQAWLVPMDRKEYVSAYDSAGMLLHQQITLQRFTGALNAIRANFGPILSRESSGHDYFPQGFATKEGEFVKLDFTTKFKSLETPYTESVILHREGGSWAIVGYTLTPPAPTAEQIAAQPFVEADEPQERTVATSSAKPIKITRPLNSPPAATSVEGSSSDPLPK